MRNSFKQLFRKPVKVILFFFLMAAATLLLVFGGAMYYQNVLRAQALESLFTTVGTVEQARLSSSYGLDEAYGDLIPLSVLDFPGANYTVPPESRPLYLADLTGYNQLSDDALTYDLLEFKVLEKPAGGPLTAQITQVFQNGTARMDHTVTGMEYNEDIRTKPGMEILLRQDAESQSLEVGKTYVGYIYDGYTNQYYGYGLTWTDEQEEYLFSPMSSPYTSQMDAQGQPVTGRLPTSEDASGYAQVTQGFYEEDGPFQDWQNMIEAARLADQAVPVLAVSNWDLLACYRDNSIRMRGRMITQEELDSGAKVCLVSKEFAQQNVLYEGDKIKLPLLCALYGYQAMNPWSFTPPCSMQAADGQPYAPFFEEEYEIVGVYTLQYPNQALQFKDMFIIPQKSISGAERAPVTYYGPMRSASTSFQIPNGTVDAFTAAFEANVPEAQQLNLSFNDMGYSRAVDSLNDSKQTAFLLFLVGLLAAASIVALLMYFFVVLERKRTAIERSLGMTKGQCRVSLMAGILALTLAATLAGSAGAGVLLDRVDAASQAELAEQNAIVTEEDTFVKDWGLGGIYNFSAQYSPWAMWDIKGNQAALGEISPPPGIYLAAPLLLCVLVGLLAAVLIDRSLKIEPILLLNSNGS